MMKETNRVGVVTFNPLVSHTSRETLKLHINRLMNLKLRHISFPPYRNLKKKTKTLRYTKSVVYAEREQECYVCHYV